MTEFRDKLHVITKDHQVKSSVWLQVSQQRMRIINLALPWRRGRTPRQPKTHQWAQIMSTPASVLYLHPKVNKWLQNPRRQNSTQTRYWTCITRTRAKIRVVPRRSECQTSLNRSSASRFKTCCKTSNQQPSSTGNKWRISILQRIWKLGSRRKGVFRTQDARDDYFI